MEKLYIYVDIRGHQYYTAHGVRIRVSRLNDIIFNGKNTGFKYVTHSFTFNGIRQLWLFNSYVTSKYVFHHFINRRPWFTSSGTVCVYFYCDDPRPLLICYGEKAHTPKDTIRYNKHWGWKEESTISKCVCEDSDEGQKEKLLKALTKVVGFLNEVNLSKHPSGNGSNGECNSAVGTVDSTCATTEKKGASCTYEVHQYVGKSVRVSVKCAPVPTVPPDGKSCYKKLIHEPAGINGKGNGDKFRLGNLVYNNGGREPQGSIDYYENGTENPNKSSHWWKPLISVSAYFYNEDKNYEDPLLVELVFANNGDSANDKEYYKLTSSGPGGKMEWEIDPGAKDQMSTDPSKYLDSIRYELKQVLRVEISCQKGYPIQLSKNPGDTKNGFTPLTGSNGGKEIKVEVCEEKCPQLTGAGYKCFVHKISSIVNGFDYNSIGGLAFTIPGQKGDDNIIQLYEDGYTGEIEALCETGEQITQLTYNRCMGDIYVYFYGSDPRPLMLCYDNKAFTPFDKDSYFNEWFLNYNISKCVCSDKSGDQNRLLDSLTYVVGFLNTVDLSKHPPGAEGNGTCAGTAPGTPSTCATTEKNGTCTYPVHNYGNHEIKVKVTCEPVKGTPPSSNGLCYKKLTHTPIGMNGASTKAGDNGFRLGDVVYNGNGDPSPKGSIDYYANGSTSNGGGNQSNHWYQPLLKVEAYFYDHDKCYKDPLLVVLEFKNGAGNVCECYKLTKRNEREMTWAIDSGAISQMSPDKIFAYLDSIRYGIKHVLKVEIQRNSSESYTAMGRAGSTPGGNGFSLIPGASGQVQVDVCEEKCPKLKEHKYKCYQHKLSSLSSNEHHKICGLTFYIPNKDGREVELELHNGEPSHSKIDKLYYNTCMGDVYVFFYGSDPRPLLLCYNNSAYAAKNMDDYYLQKWTKNGSVNKCLCDAGCSGDCNNLLDALVEVSDFLNPVKLDRIMKKYAIQNFKGQTIRIQVVNAPATEKFCYNKYTHSHNGTGTDGKGFRLGTIYYGCNCIQKNGAGNTNGGTCITSALENKKPACKYTAADQVVVFYYQGDKKFERPLLVALCENGSKTCNLYYELQKTDSSSGAKLYNKGDKTPIDLNNTTPNGPLETKLNKILSENTKHLQIILDKLPMPKLYCPKTKPETTEINGKKFENTDYKHPFNCEERQNGKSSTPVPKGNSDGVIPPSYPAKLYKPDGKPVTNGPKPATATKTVKVTLLDCKQLSRHGYRCYEHQITGVTGVEQVGGLKFFLWDNTGKGAGASCPSASGGAGTTTSTSSGAGCPSASGSSSDTCRELCLYKDSSAASRAGTSSCTAAAAVASSVPGTSCTATPGTSSQLSLVTTSYTTCKGNVYVFFYGDDPRPLLLCFAGNAYGPMCLADYESKWVCVGSGCGVEIKTVKGKPKTVCTVPPEILTQLYKASMFLNQVKLGLTRCAYKQEKPPYKYTVHTYNTKPVNVTVAPTDLSCYRQYVHRPQKEGFRLGEVSYNPSDEGSNGCKKGEASTQCQTPAVPSTQCTSQPSASSPGTPFCFEYCQSKQLIGVGLYYYMYDKPHLLPLIVELQFINDVSEYYRLSCTGGNKKWVKMVDSSENDSSKDNNCTTDNDTCTNNQGGTNNCAQDAVQKCTQTPAKTDDKETCELDKDFARNARLIEEKILKLSVTDQVDQVEFRVLTQELIALVEHRAYKIRKKLVAESQWKKENLIMATDENCHEESMLMYLVGGGAVGVAGGGGWKALVFMLGLLVKL